MNSKASIIERKEQYMKGEKHDVLKKREETNLRLRKDKLQDLIMTRRYAALEQISVDTEELTIQTKHLNLHKDFLLIFAVSPNKLQYASRLILNDDINLVKFGISQLKDLSLDLDIDVENEFAKNLDNIINLMIKSKDIQIVFESTWVIINLTQSSTVISNYLAKSSQIIKGLFNLLQTSGNFQIKNHVLWIFSNLIAEGEESYGDITNCVDILNYVCQLTQNDLILPNYIKRTLFWMIGNILKHSKDNSLALILSVFPDVVKYLHSSDDEFLFSECLFAVFRLAHIYTDEVFEFLKIANVVQVLVPLIAIDTYYYDLRQIFGILINLTWKDESNIKIMFDLNVFGYMEKFLFDYQHLLEHGTDPNHPLKKNLYIIKDFLTCISNFATSEDIKIREFLVKETKISKYLVLILNYVSNKDIVYEVLRMFYNLLGADSNKIKSELLRIQIPELFCDYLKKDYCLSTKCMCLDSINEFLKYGAEIMPNKNIVQEHMDSIGIASEIEKLTHHEEIEIAEISNQIITKYFNNNY